MGRSLPAGQLIYDQIDLYMPAGSINRVVGESYSLIQLNTFVNNSLLQWPIANGINVADCSISSGFIYFNEIYMSPGYYSIRFFPDRVGFWRLVFREPTFGQEIIRSYDIIPARSNSGNDLVASFLPTK